MNLDQLETISAIIGGFTGSFSFIWILLKNYINRPKIIIKLKDYIFRSYIGRKPYYFKNLPSDYMFCSSDGKILTIPVINNGKSPAENCKAKARYREYNDRIEKNSGKDSWSIWYTLHWSENSDDNSEEAYNSVTLPPNGGIGYVDLLMCFSMHMTLSSKVGNQLSQRVHLNNRLISLYAKPILLGEILKYPCPRVGDVNYNYPELDLGKTYQIDLSIQCKNTSEKISFCLTLKDSSNHIQASLHNCDRNNY